MTAVRAEYENSATVAAGDLISASQIASSIYLDEPAIGVLNRIGLEFSAVGNHEFDSGTEELLRKQAGGCAKYTSREPCQVEQFTGAAFQYLAASTRRADGSTIFPAFGLKHFGRGAYEVTVGFIGLTLKDTPSLVSPDGVAGLSFRRRGRHDQRCGAASSSTEGADAIVVLIHRGGKTATRTIPDADALRRTSPARSSRSSPGSTRRWTWWSRATPIGPMSAITAIPTRRARSC